MRYEAEALQTAAGFCPAHVPVVHLYDAPMSVIVMRQGGTVYNHSTDVESPPRARVYMSAHIKTKSSSDLGEVLVLNDPSTHSN